MISVIIPVYNSVERLETALRSVMAQSFTDWECIVVDDGSTDGSAAVCDRFAECDSRFRVIHQDNGGVSSARNRGLDSASGEFIAFADSDDELCGRYLEALYSAISRDGADLAICGKRTFGPDACSTEQVPQAEGTFRIDGSMTEMIVRMEEDDLLSCPFLKLFRRDIIESLGLRFEVGLAYGEDLLFNLSYLDKAVTVALVPEALYYYIIGEGTLSTRFRADMFETDYAQWKELDAFHESKGMTGYTAKEFLYRKLWGIVYDGLFLFPKIGNPPADYIDRILSIPEIDDLGPFEGTFHCSRWIKRGILKRRVWLFKPFFRIKKSFA